jgi:hypothetical protein
VSLLRPARRVLDPDGREWEVYVSRTVLPEWRPAGSELPQPPGGGGPAGVVLMAIDAVLSVLGAVLVPLVRMAVALPLAWLRGRRATSYR